MTRLEWFDGIQLYSPIRESEGKTRWSSFSLPSLAATAAASFSILFERLLFRSLLWPQRRRISRSEPASTRAVEGSVESELEQGQREQNLGQEQQSRVRVEHKRKTDENHGPHKTEAVQMPVHAVAGAATAEDTNRSHTQNYTRQSKWCDRMINQKQMLFRTHLKDRNRFR